MAHLSSPDIAVTSRYPCPHCHKLCEKNGLPKTSIIRCPNCSHFLIISDVHPETRTMEVVKLTDEAATKLLTFEFHCPQCKAVSKVVKPELRSILECAFCNELFYLKAIDPDTKELQLIKMEEGAIIESTVEEMLQDRNRMYPINRTLT